MTNKTTSFHWKGKNLFYKNIYIGSVVSMRPHTNTFRAWLMIDDDCESIGDNYPTMEAAKEALLGAIEEALK